MGMMDFKVNEDVYDRVASGQRRQRMEGYVAEGIRMIPQAIQTYQSVQEGIRLQEERERKRLAAQMLVEENKLPSSYGEAFSDDPGSLAAIIQSHRNFAAKNARSDSEFTRQSAVAWEMEQGKQKAAMDLEKFRQEGAMQRAEIRAGRKLGGTVDTKDIRRGETLASMSNKMLSEYARLMELANDTFDDDRKAEILRAAASIKDRMERYNPAMERILQVPGGGTDWSMPIGPGNPATLPGEPAGMGQYSRAFADLGQTPQGGGENLPVSIEEFSNWEPEIQQRFIEKMKAMGKDVTPYGG